MRYKQTTAYLSAGGLFRSWQVSNWKYSLVVDFSCTRQCIHLDRAVWVLHSFQPIQFPRCVTLSYNKFLI